MLVQVDPTRLEIRDVNVSDLDRLLTYRDKKVDFELRALKNRHWLRSQLGEERFQEEVEALKAQRVKTLLSLGTDGTLSTMSGLAGHLMTNLPGQVLENRVVYPEAKIMPWAKVPQREHRPYQIQAKEALLKARHGAVEIGTGLGKSFIALMLVKELGLKTLVMAPSLNIAKQLLREFRLHLGANRVGAYFGAKKEFTKQVTIGISQGLTKIEAGSAAALELGKCEVFIADESHLTPAATLRKICFELVKAAPYRFFFSGTQMRGDGLDMLLEGIIGPVVFTMTVKEGVDQGYLARPNFRMIDIPSKSGYQSQDINKMTRKHLYYNPDVNSFAAGIANMSFGVRGEQVLILVDEFEQFTSLLPMFRYRVGFAHGGVTKENKGSVPEEYHKSDPEALVDEFNAGKLPILVGTSCICTGTDIQAVKTMIYLRGGRSEIELRQGVGRSTRLVPGKTFCNIYDIRVSNIEALNRHANDRKIIEEDIYGPVEEIHNVGF